MTNILRHYILLASLLIIGQFLYGQNKFVRISFKLEGQPQDDSTVIIHIVQKDSLISCRLNQYASVMVSQPMRVDFLNSKTPINSISYLVIFSDTTVELQSAKGKLLKEVIIKSKKYIVKQTLSGFEYNPQIDSFFYNKSILLALQRLPFVRLELDKLKYKQGEAILFTINGKERPGITNWSDLLRNIKAKDIYKVDLITDVPSIIQKRGFTVIINILTADVNIYGHSISVIALPDQRKNINSNLNITVLQKRTDISIGISNQQDNQKASYETKVYKNDVLITDNQLQSKNIFKNYNGTFKYGLRIDSSKDFSASISVGYYKAKNLFTSNYNFPISLVDQENNLTGRNLNLNISYFYRRSRFVNSYIALAANVTENSLSSRISYIQKRNYDSLNNISKLLPYNIAFDYSYTNNKQNNNNIELGVLSYIRHTNQNYSKYTLNTLNENNLLLYNKEDTLSLLQTSIDPYVKYSKIFSKKSNLIVKFNTEYYAVKDNTLFQAKFILPSITLIQKNILRNNNSISLRGGFDFKKPGLDFLTPIQFTTNPIFQSIGNSNLKPSKTIYIGGDWLLANDIYITQSITFYHNYDVTNFFTKFDSVSNKLIQYPDNKNIINNVTYSIDYDNEWFNKLSLYTYLQISWFGIHNNLYNTKNTGFGFSMTNNLTYQLGKKRGSFGLTTFINGRNYTSQGNSLGGINYSFYYAKTFFKRRIAVTLLANEFLKGYRTIKTTNLSDAYQQYIYDRRPFRLLAFRIAYNFSNIKLRKIATEKKAFIRGEINK